MLRRTWLRLRIALVWLRMAITLPIDELTHTYGHPSSAWLAEAKRRAALEQELAACREAAASKIGG